MEQMISLTPDQLAEIITAAVDKALKKGRASEDEDLLDILATIKYLNCSRQHLWNLRQQGKIRALELGGKLLFSKKALNAFLERSQEEEVSDGE